MMYLNDQLIQVIGEVFKEGNGLDESLARVVREAYKKDKISFSLQSQFGPFVDSAPKSPELAACSLKSSELQPLLSDRSDTRRFVFSISSKVVENISCFLVNNQTFYATIILKETDSKEQFLYSEIIHLMNILCIRCQTVITDYMQPLIKLVDGCNTPNDPYHKETQALRRISELSSSLHCIALIDNDGFILNKHGNGEEIEKVASNLARFHQRCIRELGFMDNVITRSATFSCQETSVLIGQIEHTNLALAISAQGKHSRPCVSFLFDVAHSALTRIAKESGTLWGSPIDQIIDPTWMRTSWFGAAYLVPQGKFVGKKGGKAFHLCSCNSLIKSEESSLTWYKKRAEAIRAGLEPCKSCNP